MIVRDPNIMCGKPTIKGTRLTVELIKKLLNSMTIEKIKIDYELTDKQIESCINYNFTHF